MAPHRIVDEVVVHELCHLNLTPMHSSAFWKPVARIVPDDLDRKDCLREVGGEFNV